MNRFMIHFVGATRANIWKLTSMGYCDSRNKNNSQTTSVEDEYTEYTDQLKIDQIGMKQSLSDIPVSTNRGINGVFDPEDLVTFLRYQNTRDIFCTSIAPEMRYADYMVIVTCNSMRHIRAVAESVRKMHKIRKRKDDPYVDIEGLNSKSSHEWLAMDMGNIILHLFMAETRKVYDLESLWSVGPEFDKNFLDMKQYVIDSARSPPSEIPEISDLDEAVKNINWGSIGHAIKQDKEREVTEIKEYLEIVEIRKKEMNSLLDLKPNK